jgi:hypothetical protein
MGNINSQLNSSPSSTGVTEDEQWLKMTAFELSDMEVRVAYAELTWRERIITHRCGDYTGANKVLPEVACL